MKEMMKNANNYNIPKKSSTFTSEFKIKSYKSTTDKKIFQNTCHVFGSEKQNKHEHAQCSLENYKESQ